MQSIIWCNRPGSRASSTSRGSRCCRTWAGTRPARGTGACRRRPPGGSPAGRLARSRTSGDPSPRGRRPSCRRRSLDRRFRLLEEWKKIKMYWWWFMIRIDHTTRNTNLWLLSYKICLKFFKGHPLKSLNRISDLKENWLHSRREGVSYVSNHKYQINRRARSAEVRTDLHRIL